MSDEGAVQAPADSAAQASTDNSNTPSNQSPPPTGAQDSVDTKSSNEAESNADPKANTPDPSWRQRGFKSEEAFLSSYDEGRRALSKSQREAAGLRKKAKSYADYVEGKLDTPDIAKYTDEQDVAIQYQEDVKELKRDRDVAAINNFKSKHADLEFEDISRIYHLSPNRNGTWSERLASGYKVYKDIQNRTKKSQAAKTQKEMSATGEIVTGSSKAPSSTPNFKTMSSSDFASYVAAQRAR